MTCFPGWPKFTLPCPGTQDECLHRVSRQKNFLAMGKHTATSLVTAGERIEVRTEPGLSSILNSQHTASWSFYCKEAYNLPWKTWLEFRSRKVWLLQWLEAENDEVVPSYHQEGDNWLRPWSNAKCVESAPKNSSEGGRHPPSFQAISFTVGNNRLQQRKQQTLHNLWPQPLHQLWNQWLLQ